MQGVQLEQVGGPQAVLALQGLLGLQAWLGEVASLEELQVQSGLAFLLESQGSPERWTY